jgi:Na(+)-translocating NADH:ubiquinone oxidoreductase F subunit
MIFFRKLHKWLTLIIGIQLIIWLLTGTIISFIDQDKVSGNVTRVASSDGSSLSTSESYFPVSRLPLRESSIRTVTLELFLGHPVYRVDQGDTGALFDARSGKRLTINSALAEEIATKSYRGNGHVSSSERFDSGSNEVRAVKAPVWRVNFKDSLATRVYVAAEDGQLLAHRNNRWKVVDFLLMLHFMDYVRADSFNNLQIIIVGFGTFWIALSGLLLVFYSFSRSNFLWLPGMKSRGRMVNSTVGAEGQLGQVLKLDSLLSYYASLSQCDIKLSSNCDGSGSCGLCKVRYERNAPAHTAADREWIGVEELANGLRLGCQHKPRSNDAVTVPDIAFQQSVLWAEVVSSRWLTPLLKEIRIRPDVSLQFVSGDYLEFQIPQYQMSLTRLAVPESFAEVWDKLSIPDSWGQTKGSETSRTYSIAVAPNQSEPQELAFNVRFAPPPAGTQFLPGVGSSFLCGSQEGERLAFRGPAGDFRLVDSDREKILIGGGAGMAPLKSMVVHLLKNRGWQGKVRFWYGARNQPEILYRETFETLAKEHENFEWQVALSEATDDLQWQGHRGLIHRAIFEEVLKDHSMIKECEFYVCGPPSMLAATRRMLRDLGVSDASVRFDDFGN